MSRLSLAPRIARREDAPALAELWCDVLRRADRAEQIADLELVIKAAAASPEQRFVVVEYDGQLAGSVFLRLTTVSPINLDPCVQSIQPRVFDQFRRRGVGRALMEAAVAFAEENGVLHVTTAVRRRRATPTGSWRDSRSHRSPLSGWRRPRRTQPADAAARAGSGRTRLACWSRAATSAGRGPPSPSGRSPTDQPGQRGSISAQVMREVHTRLPRSSTITIS